MTVEEKAKKILSAEKDLEKLNNFLVKGNLHNADDTVRSITLNKDYAKAIIASRVKYKMPFGDKSFGSLSFTEKRRVIIMLIDAVQATLQALELSRTDDKNDGENK